MNSRMTIRTEGNQILLRVCSRVAPKLPMMDFQVCHRAAGLTAPVISDQDLLPKILVGERIKPQTFAAL